MWDLGARCQRGKRCAVGHGGRFMSLVCYFSAAEARCSRSESPIFHFRPFVQSFVQFFFPPLVGGVCFWDCLFCFGASFVALLLFSFCVPVSHFILAFISFHFIAWARSVGKGGWRLAARTHRSVGAGAAISVHGNGGEHLPLCPRGRTARRASSAPRGDGRAGPRGQFPSFPIGFCPNGGWEARAGGRFVRPSAGAVRVRLCCVGASVPRRPCRRRRCR